MQQDHLTQKKQDPTPIYAMTKLGHDTYLEGQKIAATEREILLDMLLILKLF